MIVVTRLNGPPVALNCDLIERAEATPDTVVTLLDGTKYVVQESLEEVIQRIQAFRASVIALAQKLEAQTSAPGAVQPVLQLVHDTEE
ncbi:MAG TPA: flagellar FlbD family protein [Acidimicrobiia bacterium]|nr:flagellar FlbD family protein [Acidimicrobiia bacterium]